MGACGQIEHGIGHWTLDQKVWGLIPTTGHVEVSGKPLMSCYLCPPRSYWNLVEQIIQNCSDWFLLKKIPYLLDQTPGHQSVDCVWCARRQKEQRDQFER